MNGKKKKGAADAHPFEDPRHQEELDKDGQQALQELIFGEELIDVLAFVETARCPSSRALEAIPETTRPIIYSPLALMKL